MKWRTVIAPAAVILVLGLVAVQARQRTGALTALDYVQIQQLYGRFSIAVDSGNGDLLAGAFTPDGVLELPSGSFQGREKLMEFATRGANKGPTNVVHNPSNVTIEPSPEGATATAYVLLVNIGQGGTPSTLTSGGIYHDVFVKGPDGWRIKKRSYSPAHSVQASKPGQ